MTGLVSVVIALGPAILAMPLTRKLGIDLEHGACELFPRNVRNIALTPGLD